VAVAGDSAIIDSDHWRRYFLLSAPRCRPQARDAHEMLAGQRRAQARRYRASAAA
jgi:hypothetical protein